MPKTWTMKALRVYHRDLRKADQALAKERDRRYAEVEAEREKAVRIKDHADEQALNLARQAQTAKDDMHNGLLKQIGEERGTYATKDDVAAAVKEINATYGPLVTWATSQQGQQSSVTDSRTSRRLDASLRVIIIGVVVSGTFNLIGAIVSIVIATR